LQAAIDGSGTTSYALDDALGSVRGLTDSSGALTGSTDYDVFGAVRAQTGTSLPLGFTGELNDPTNGFLDLQARDLDPALGRFLSRDSVSPNAPGSQGYNPYAYVANNPTTWVDPSDNNPLALGPSRLRDAMD
jgi:RHS repeat-associated protein